MRYMTNNAGARGLLRRGLRSLFIRMKVTRLRDAGAKHHHHAQEDHPEFGTAQHLVGLHSPAERPGEIEDVQVIGRESC